MTVSTLDLYNDFRKILAEGTEQEARKYLVDHFGEFPEDVQGEIALSLLEEALVTQDLNTGASISAFQEQGMKAIDSLVRERGEAEDQVKAQELEEKLKENS